MNDFSDHIVVCGIVIDIVVSVNIYFWVQWWRGGSVLGVCVCVHMRSC